MLRIGGTATVACDQEFTSGAKRSGDRGGDGVDCGAQLWIVRRSRQRFAGAAEVIGDQIVLSVPIAVNLIAHDHFPGLVDLT